MCGPSLAERPERQAAVDRSRCSRLTSRRSPVRAGHRPSSRARLGSGTSTIASADNMSRNGAVEALWKRGAARRSRGGGLRAPDGVPPRPASPTPGVLRSTTFHPRRGSGPRSACAFSSASASKRSTHASPSSLDALGSLEHGDAPDRSARRANQPARDLHLGLPLVRRANCPPPLHSRSRSEMRTMVVRLRRLCPLEAGLICVDLRREPR